MLELADPPINSWLDLPPYLLQDLQRHTTVVAVPVQARIYSEGDLAGAVYLVERGEIRLHRHQPEREYTLAHLGAGEIFGEMALLEEAPRDHHATVSRAARLRVLYRDTYQLLARRWPQLRHFVAVTLARRLRQANRQIEVLSFAKTKGRVAHALLELHHTGGLARPITHQELAQRAKVSRELVGRILGELHRQGVVVYEGGRLRVADPPALEGLLLA